MKTPFSLRVKNFFANIPLIATPITAWELAANGYINRTPKYRSKQQRKLVWFSLLNFKFAVKWFATFKSPELSNIAQQRPRMVVKPFRPYISIKWNKNQKVKVLLDTYKFMENKGGLLAQVLANPEGVVVSRFIFENQYEGFLVLGYSEGFRKEGELALSFDCEQLGGRVTSVAFSFEEIKKGEWAGIVGCIQGHKSQQVDEAFKLTQKLLHGLRPNAFIFYTSQELLRNLGLQTIYGIGRSIHVSINKHLINLPWKQNISFDYNKFWLEAGGHSINDDWYELPLVPIRKSIQEVKSQKRSMYSKRYEMLDSLSLQIANSVNAPQDTNNSQVDNKTIYVSKEVVQRQPILS